MRQMLRLGALSVVAAMGMALWSGCGDDDNSYDQVIAKARSCGLISDGTVNSPPIESSDPEGQCYMGCYVKASCDDLTAMMCGVGTVSTATQTCFDNCEGGSRFTCADGSDTISSDWVCDGESDCQDGSDEVGCPTFDCADGSGSIVQSFVCNYYEDCPDGSDEVGCSGFHCADGSGTIDPDWVCNYYEDCQDGSDEAGCPDGFHCADGSYVINPDWVCDYYEDCQDGSDEADCPDGFHCADGSDVINPDSVCDLYEDCPDGSDEAQGCATMTCPE